MDTVSVKSRGGFSLELKGGAVNRDTKDVSPEFLIQKHCINKKGLS